MPMTQSDCENAQSQYRSMEYNYVTGTYKTRNQSKAKKITFIHKEKKITIKFICYISLSIKDKPFIRCYILLKSLIKFEQPKVSVLITSYMFTVLYD